MKRGNVAIPQRRMRKHIYPPVGKCIYCTSDGAGAGFRSEHIIPGGLGGRLVLPAASCHECEKETSALEGRVLGLFFGDARAHFGVRREQESKRKWPATLPVPIVDENGNATTIEVPMDDHPNILWVVKLAPPRIFSDTQPEESFRDAFADGVGDRDLMRRIKKIGPNKRIGLTGGSIHIDEFGRFLAKIVHSFAVAEKGIGNFNPFLSNAILNKRPMYLGYYIGRSSTASVQNPDVHEISMRKAEVRGRQLWIVRIHVCGHRDRPSHHQRVKKYAGGSR